jgi:hypothetical protein
MQIFLIYRSINSADELLLSVKGGGVMAQKEGDCRYAAREVWKYVHELMRNAVATRYLLIQLLTYSPAAFVKQQHAAICSMHTAGKSIVRRLSRRIYIHIYNLRRIYLYSVHFQCARNGTGWKWWLAVVSLLNVIIFSTHAYRSVVTSRRSIKCVYSKIFGNNYNKSKPDSGGN